eukprot:6279537-Alexandrium_andersonii.AAC.1
MCIRDRLQQRPPAESAEARQGYPGPEAHAQRQVNQAPCARVQHSDSTVGSVLKRARWAVR